MKSKKSVKRARAKLAGQIVADRIVRPGEFFCINIVQEKEIRMNIARTIYFADGTPVPEVMLEKELVKLLRLRELGIKNPTNTLRYYRERGKLKPTRIGNRNAYTLNDVCAFLERLRPRK